MHFDYNYNSSVLFIPPEIFSALTLIECPSCKKKDSTIIQEVLKLPIEPIKTNDKKDRWIPVSKNVKCKHCNSIINIPLPSNTPKADIDIYCDESKTIKDKYVIFSGGGNIKGKEEHFHNKTKNLKVNLFGTDTKILHMIDLWNGDRRKKKYSLTNNDFDNIKQFIDDWTRLFRDGTEKGWYIQFLGFFKKSDLINILSKLKLKTENHEIWNIVYVNFCWFILNELTKQNVAVSIKYENAENDRVDVRGRKRTFWLDKCFEAEKKRLIFPFITNGIYDNTIEYVAKGIHHSIEHADMLSYFAQKCIFGNIKDREFFSPEKLGRVKTISFDGDDLFATNDLRRIIRKHTAA